MGSQILPIFSLALGLLACGASLRAAPGTLIAEYRAASGILPNSPAPGGQPWELQAQCLRAECPAIPDFCHWQGRQDRNGDSQFDNDCRFSVGCRRPDNTQHYNSPPAILNGPAAACANTEWLVFDDGNNEDGRLQIPDSIIPGSPPWGAPTFFRAPADYWPLRISTGDGNIVPLSLPWAEGNDRNLGKIRFRKLISWPADDAVTMVAKIAAGPVKQNEELLEIRTPGYRFGFTINGDPTSPDLGRVGYRGWLSFGGYLFGQNRVLIAQPSAVGATGGEFFIIRAICRGDGTFTAYLNEDLATATQGTVPGVTSSPELAFGVVRLEDECFWVDYLQFFEGAIPPPICPEPIFDLNMDGRVDAADLNGSGLTLENCATGPGITPTQFRSLPVRCQCLDVNSDEAIDSIDFAAFQRCLTVGGHTPDHSCD